MPPYDLTGARVLVLGGSGELGRRIARELRTRGASVMLAGRDADRLQAAASELGPDVPSVQFDLRRPEVVLRQCRCRRIVPQGARER